MNKIEKSTNHQKKMLKKYQNGQWKNDRIYGIL
jgi:hypothetical protein